MCRCSENKQQPKKVFFKIDGGGEVSKQLGNWEHRIVKKETGLPIKTQQVYFSCY